MSGFNISEFDRRAEDFRAAATRFENSSVALETARAAVGNAERDVASARAGFIAAHTAMNDFVDSVNPAAEDPFPGPSTQFPPNPQAA